MNHLSFSKRKKQLQFNIEKDIGAFQKLLTGVHCACSLFQQEEAKDIAQALKQRVNGSNALGQLFVLFSAALLCACTASSFQRFLSTFTVRTTIFLC